MTLSYVRHARTKGYLKIGVKIQENKYELTVAEKDFHAIGAPSQGELITKEAFDRLSYCDMEYRARLKALRILSFGDNSERMLAKKLAMSKFSRDVIEKTVSEMKKLGYINTDRQLELLITNEVKLHNAGPRKIVAKLVAKGYSAKDASDKISELQARGEIDFDAAKERLVESRLKGEKDSEQIKKLLYKNGYFV